MKIIRLNTQILENPCRAWMNRKHYWQAMYIGDTLMHQALQFFGFVHIGGAVQGQSEKPSSFQSQLIVHSRLDETCTVGQQGVNHHITDEKDLFLSCAKTPQILVGHLGGREEIVGEAVRHHAVDFLGHSQVPRPDARLDMTHFRAQFFSHDGTRHGGSNIAHHQDQVGRMRPQVLLEGHHDSGRLLGLRAAAATQIDIRLGDVEFLEKRLAHLPIVVLTRMHETILDFLSHPLRPLDRMNQRRNLHEIRARACDKSDMMHSYLNPN